MLTLKQAIEALVFASPKPLTLEEIRTALRGAAADSEDLNMIAMGETTEEEVASQLNLLRAEYEQTGRSFQIAEQANGWAIVTIPAAGDWVRQLYPESRPTRLSGPALETLAIIAYRQPVTRADIEAVRGVAVDGVMQVLLDRALVKIAGRAELPGRPLLYETTEYFLQHFGIRDVEELPNSDELRRVSLPKAEYPEEGSEKPGKRKKKADAAETPAPAEATASVEATSGELPAEQSPEAAPSDIAGPDPTPDPTSDAAVVYEAQATTETPPETTAEASEEPAADETPRTE
jgi:segregation and condensation protein B